MKHSIAGYKRPAAVAAASSSGHSAAHPGFKSVAASIAKREGVSKESAGAILASAARGSSLAAHKANPRLARVRG